MSDHVFKLGDLVRLKSGGPTMLIEEKSYKGDDKSWVCRWFDSVGSVHAATFPAWALEQVLPVSSGNDAG